MCESYTIYHLCGHVKIKTIVQCADIIDKLIASGLPITSNHQVCEEDVSDNVHIFPDISDKCKKTGVIGDVMEVPGMKLEVLKAWKSQKKRDPSAGGGSVAEEESESDQIKELETLDSVSLPEDVSTSTPGDGSVLGTSKMTSRSSSTTSNSTTPELSQIKSRVATLLARTERLLIKIRVQKPPNFERPSR